MENNVVLPEQSPYMMDAKQLARYKATRLGEGLAENEKELVVCSPCLKLLLYHAYWRLIKFIAFIVLMFVVKAYDVPLVSKWAAFLLPWAILGGILFEPFEFWMDVLAARKTFFVVTSQRIIIRDDGFKRPDIWMKDIREACRSGWFAADIKITTVTDGHDDYKHGNDKHKGAQIFDIHFEAIKKIMSIIEEKRKEQMMK